MRHAKSRLPLEITHCRSLLRSARFQTRTSAPTIDIALISSIVHLERNSVGISSVNATGAKHIIGTTTALRKKCPLLTTLPCVLGKL